MSTTVVGSLGSDPELRFTQNGTAVANFSVAQNERRKTASGEWEDAEATWVPVTVWGKMAENVADTLGRGDRVVVTGRLREHRWENDSGDKRSRLELTADEIGPSLRWAQATIEKNPKNGGDRPPASSYDSNEEPFSYGGGPA